jgi:LysM repeat protein
MTPPDSSPSPTSDAASVSFGRRRRRTSSLQQWLPSFLLMVIVGGIAGSILALRTLGSAAPTETPASPPAQPQIVGDPAVDVSAPPASRAEQPSNRGSIRFTVQPIEPSYVVVAGDSLSSIAQRFNTTVDALQAINNLPDRSTLSVGQRLVIP